MRGCNESCKRLLRLALDVKSYGKPHIYPQLTFSQTHHIFRPNVFFFFHGEGTEAYFARHFPVKFANFSHPITILKIDSLKYKKTACHLIEYPAGIFLTKVGLNPRVFNQET